MCTHSITLCNTAAAGIDARYCSPSDAVRQACRQLIQWAVSCEVQQPACPPTTRHVHTLGNTIRHHKTCAHTLPHSVTLQLQALMQAISHRLLLSGKHAASWSSGQIPARSSSQPLHHNTKSLPVQHVPPPTPLTAQKCRAGVPPADQAGSFPQRPAASLCTTFTTLATHSQLLQIHYVLRQPHSPFNAVRQACRQLIQRAVCCDVLQPANPPNTTHAHTATPQLQAITHRSMLTGKRAAT
jgi:hypothetical protein